MRKIYLKNKNDIFQVIYSVKTNRIKRNKLKLIFVESITAIKEIIKLKLNVDSVLVSKNKLLSDWAKKAITIINPNNYYILEDNLMNELSDKESISEIILLVEKPVYSLHTLQLPQKPFILILDRPSNSGNLGTIIRSADAFIVDVIIIMGHSVDPFDPAVIRASLGAIFHIPVLNTLSLKELTYWFKELKLIYKELKIIGTDSKGSIPLNTITLKPPLCICFGNESSGLSINLKSYMDHIVSIPISGHVNSLNIACATSIFLNKIYNS